MPCAPHVRTCPSGLPFTPTQIACMIPPILLPAPAWLLLLLTPDRLLHKIYPASCGGNYAANFVARRADSKSLHGCGDRVGLWRHHCRFADGARRADGVRAGTG